MYYIVLGLQWINITLVMIESWIVFFNMRSRQHSFLYLNTVATLVYVTGYLHAIFSTSEDAYYQALMMAWSGRVWIAISLLLFAIDLCKVRFPKALAIIEGLLAVVSYSVILSNKNTGLFFYDTHFTIENKLPIYDFTMGIWYYAWETIAAGTVLTAIYLLVLSFLRVSNFKKKRQYRTVIAALSIYLLSGIINFLPMGRYYDFTQIGASACAILIIVSILKYRLFDTESIAREYIVDELSAGVIAADQDGKVAYFNKAANLVFPELDTDPANVLSRVKETITEGKPVSIGDRIYTFEERDPLASTPDGSKIYVLSDDTDYFKYLKDVEEQKQIADRANQAKSRFLASMSHEIRTPINTVLGMNEMILRETRESSIREYAGDIRSAGNTLLSIINDILDLSKIESGKMEIVRHEYDVAMLIYETTNIISGWATDKGLSFELDVDRNIPAKMLGDDIRIKQVLMNILSNAVKYTVTGSVSVRVSLVSTGEQDGKNYATIHCEVEDTGIGIREEDMAKMFSPFERLELDRNRNIEGTGLGMAITMRLLSMMDSKLVVKSEYGKGSVFSFDLTEEVTDVTPIGDFDRRVTKVALEESEATNIFTAPGVNILVVDDNRTNRKVLRLLLKHTEIEIDEADSGASSIEMAREKHYDIIFMDHMMPEMDGIEAMKHIRSDDKGMNLDTPIIILTANAVAGSREMYLGEGFDGYLSKPISAAKLEETIKDVLLKEEEDQE